MINLTRNFHEWLNKPAHAPSKAQVRLFNVACVLILAELAMLTTAPMATIYGVRPAAISRDEIPTDTEYERVTMLSKDFQASSELLKNRMMNEKNPGRRAQYKASWLNACKQAARVQRAADNTQQ